MFCTVKRSCGNFSFTSSPVRDKRLEAILVTRCGADLCRGENALRVIPLFDSAEHVFPHQQKELIVGILRFQFRHGVCRVAFARAQHFNIRDCDGTFGNVRRRKPAHFNTVCPACKLMCRFVRRRARRNQNHAVKRQTLNKFLHKVHMRRVGWD